MASPAYSTLLTVPDQTAEYRNLKSQAESFTPTDIISSEQGSSLEAVLHWGKPSQEDNTCECTTNSSVTQVLCWDMYTYMNGAYTWGWNHIRFSQGGRTRSMYTQMYNTCKVSRFPKVPSVPCCQYTKRFVLCLIAEHPWRIGSHSTARLQKAHLQKLQWN